ncbi:MAG: glycine betaine ABC transporter substrate-binding protein [Pseudonocardiaceae bacterium]
MTRTARLCALLAALALGATACGGDDGGGGGGDDGPLAGASLTVGSKEFNEQLLLGQIAIIALEDAGADVQDETGIQGTENVRKALLSGEIDLYWEYTGTGWTSHLGHDVTDAPKDTQELADQVAEEDLENGVVWLDPAGANNTYAIAAATGTAERLGVGTLSDYAELVNQDPAAGSLCAAAEFLDRPDGWPGVEKAYGFDLPRGQITEMDLNLIYARVPQADPCNFGEVFATDGRIVGNDLKIIEDDQEVFVKYNIALTVRQEIMDQYPVIKEIFNPITERLTNEKMLELNERVDVNAELPEDVAQEFLEQEGLIG